MYNNFFGSIGIYFYQFFFRKMESIIIKVIKSFNWLKGKLKVGKYNSIEI